MTFMTYDNNSIIDEVNSISPYEDDYTNVEYGEEVFYEEGEQSTTKYNVVLCEIFNNVIHGKSTIHIENHYLNICTFKEFNLVAVADMCNLYNGLYLETIHTLYNHAFIRNYQNIISNPNYIKPEIGENIYLLSGHRVCIIKTIWLKLVQRAWKKTYKNKLAIIKKRCLPHSIRTKEITGKWPDNCKYLPNIRGMLSKLKQ